MNFDAAPPRPHHSRFAMYEPGHQARGMGVSIMSLRRRYSFVASPFRMTPLYDSTSAQPGGPYASRSYQEPAPVTSNGAVNAASKIVCAPPSNGEKVGSCAPATLGLTRAAHVTQRTWREGQWDNMVCLLRTHSLQRGAERWVTLRLDHGAASRHRGGVTWELHTAGRSLHGVVRRMVGWRERGAPLRRLEPATTATPVILMLGPRISIDGDPVGSFAAGPYLRPVVTEHDGEQEGIQVDLEPLAARRLLGLPMSELAERCVALEDLIGRGLTEWVADAPGWPGRFERVESALARRLSEAQPVRGEMQWAVGRLQARGGRVRVEELARELGWSRRHLAVQFR